MRRISFNDGNQAPVIASAAAIPNKGAAPLTVWLNATGTDAENETIVYTWVVQGTRLPGGHANQLYVY